MSPIPYWQGSHGKSYQRFEDRTMKGLFKVGTMFALVGGVTALAAMVAPPAQAYDHCYHERAARAYWHHERWLADHRVYPAYVVPRYGEVPMYIAPAPMYRRVIY